MARAPKQFYLTNRELLKEIHNSKLSYCYVKDESFTFFDAIVNDISEITQEVIDAAKQTRATRAQKEAHDAEVKRWEKGLTGKKTKPKAADFAISVDTILDTDIVIRVMTFNHIPEEPGRKNKPKQEADYHAKCNFPPFKHFNLEEDGSWTEVARSHWEGGLENGAFSTTHGETNSKLAMMYMKLCERYSMRGNWRGYTYVDEMRGQALLQLAQIGLQFNEAKSSNPFAYYTAAINNSFTRVLNLEKRSQEIRDDLLEEGGLSPSNTRTFNAEWNAHEEREKEELQQNLDATERLKTELNNTTTDTENTGE